MTEEEGKEENEIVALDGIKPLKRQEEDFIMLGTKSKLKGKKGKKKEKKNGFITHSIDTIESFGMLDMDPPILKTSIQHTIECIQQKKKYYQNAPRPNDPSEEKENQKTFIEKKPMKSKYQEKDHYFPQLNGYDLKESLSENMHKMERFENAYDPCTEMLMPNVQDIPMDYKIYQDDAAFGKNAPSLESLNFLHQDEKKGTNYSKPTAILFWGKIFKGEYETIVSFSKLSEKYSSQCDFLGISLDSNEDDIKKFVSKLGTAMPEQNITCLEANFPLAFDEGRQVKNAFQKVSCLSSIPASMLFLINGNGKIVWRERLNCKSYPLEKSLYEAQLQRIIKGESLIETGNSPVVENEEEEEEVVANVADDAFDAFADY